MSRIRANQITNQSADGAPTVQNGLVISGVTTSTTFSGSGASLTNLPAGNLTGTVADARISTLTASKLTGALPALDGSNLTGITQTTINNNGNNKIITGSGTANTLEAEGNFTFDNGVADITGKLRIDVSSTSGAGSGNVEGIFLRNLTETDGNAVAIFAGADDYARAASAINFINTDHSADAGEIQFDTRNASNSYAGRVQIKSSGGLVSTKGGGIPFSDGYSAIEARAPEGTTQLTVTNTTYESGTFDNETGIWFKGNYSGNDERAKSAIIHKNTGDFGVGDLYFCIDGNADNSNATVSDVKMKITKDGQVTKPSQVGFHATGTATYNRTSSFVPEFNTEYFDIGGGYNNSNYRFTAPVTGRYFLYFQYLTYPNSDPDYKTFLFRKNGSSSGLYNQGFYRGREGQQGNQTSQQMSTYIQLAENDYVEPYVEMSGGTFYNYMGSGHSHFWGFLVH